MNSIRFWLMVLIAGPALADNADPTAATLEQDFSQAVRPLIVRYCQDCHSEQLAEGEIDLARFTSFAQVEREPGLWQHVGEMISSRQMPPPDSLQPSDEERQRLADWVRSYIRREAARHAGDPGPVVLRRLNNAEYNYTIRDLTGIESLHPTREFPVDGAAGEGFTNTGQSLVMSPALVSKYLESAKAISRHLVLLPDGTRFSPHTTRADWTNEVLDQIRSLYAQHAEPGNRTTRTLQGVNIDTHEGGRLPVERYLAVLLREREAIRSGAKTLDLVAEESGLSRKYLGRLQRELEDGPRVDTGLPLDGLRKRWDTATVDDVPEMVEEISRWQRTLWQFQNVGHIGKVGGPTAWMEPLDPIAERREVRFLLPAETPQSDIVLHLTVGTAGDGAEDDLAIWVRPRLRIMNPGGNQPEVLLQDVRALCDHLAERRRSLPEEAVGCLAGAARFADDPAADVETVAREHGVDPERFATWLKYLGVRGGPPATLGSRLSVRGENIAGHAWVRGWVGPDSLGVVINASDQEVRIPGLVPPGGVAVHPAPTRHVGIAWHCFEEGTLAISGAVKHAHPDCGNGIAWSLELRRGYSRQPLATGTSQGDQATPFPKLDRVQVLPRDILTLIVDPREGNHACDLTTVEWTIETGQRRWDLAEDLAEDILASNPHPDRYETPAVWEFFSEPTQPTAGMAIPPGSILARWIHAKGKAERAELAAALSELLRTNADALPADAPDKLLYHQLASPHGPLLADEWQRFTHRQPAGSAEAPYGLDPTAFGQGGVDPASLLVRAPSHLEVRLPVELFAGAELVVETELAPNAGPQGSVQFFANTTDPPDPLRLHSSQTLESTTGSLWTDSQRSLAHEAPVITHPGSPAHERFTTAFASLRELFPPFLCYTQIIPVDEVVTLTLYHREDDHLRRLILDEAETERLDRLWRELRFISQDAFLLVDAFQQIMEYATQDADPSVFAPMREPLQARANAFARELIAAEPEQLESIIHFAQRAYRRPASTEQAESLRAFYRSLRDQELPHDEAIRLTLARVLTSPAFLYRLEVPPEGTGQAMVSDFEMATRLSYFLWSTTPDDELLASAHAGRLSQPDELLAQTRRMYRDPKIRRLATEFACQWLHLYDFAESDEKSEQHFPTFHEVQGAMHEEVVQFFTDFFQHDRSVLSLLDADHAFLNETLARHYGIEGLSGPAWRRVENVRQHGRGGVLGFAAVLSKQAGASRTSPILRGAWLSEVILGEKLPRPPADVPVLPDVPNEGLTERQLTERHSTDSACAKCHQRIDPMGFALEHFDAIGRFREVDASGLPVDARTTLPDGAAIDGHQGLRDYLLSQRRDAFVHQFHRKLLGYALGRPLHLSDEVLLDELDDALARNDYRVSASIEHLVGSPAFRQIREKDFTADP